MTTTPAPAPSPIVMCARHSDVETALSCGRCGTPICPRCLVHTPGGTRCPDCAMLRRPPMYELSRYDYAKALAAAWTLAIPLGFVGAFLPSGIGIISMMIALFAGSGAGTLIALVIERVTNHKRGTGVQAIAIGAVILAGAVRFSLFGAPLAFLVRDISGVFLVVIAASVAWTRLR